MSKILLMPGASATGRDFLLEKILKHPEIISQRIGMDRPVQLAIVTKITDRSSRTVELTKKCVSEEEFTVQLGQGAIFADYVLESNGKRYGYHIEAFAPKADADLLVADASIYQVDEIKNRLKERVYTAAMIATRDYRKANLLARGSETSEEVTKRLNLGDAHVVLAILMSGREDLDFSDFVEPGFADQVASLCEFAKRQMESSMVEKAIEKFSGSKNVPELIKRLTVNKSSSVDELVVMGDEHRLSPDVSVTDSQFFGVGVNIVKKALR